jgi:hypothetical protein
MTTIITAEQVNKEPRLFILVSLPILEYHASPAVYRPVLAPACHSILLRNSKIVRLFCSTMLDYAVFLILPLFRGV